MTKGIPPYRLKIERAKRHVHELAQAIEGFWAKHPYVIVAEDNPATRKRKFKVRVNECVPIEWSAIVGDAIHNARSALDILLVEVVRFCDPGRTSYNHVHFIVGESKDKFEARLAENIKGASPEARLIIEKLKPYKGGDEAFWRLHHLDILDKHKAIIPVASAFAAFGVTLDVRKGLPDEFFADIPFDEWPGPITTFFAPAGGPISLKDGTHVATCSLDDPSKDDHKFRFEITFGKAQILDDEPVVPALTQICQFVEGVFDVFETGLPGFKP